ncbi:MAG: hypothetical protein ACUVRL_11105 [Candidatus Saccharicenans sp.]|uniref:hypothetical protein n=1 Tax=Candidatus Saccharicenans sp. TaxID=2819258 RepID=UPI004048F99F
MIFKKRRNPEARPEKLEDLGRNLPSAPVQLNDDSARSRRQTLKLLVGGAAFLAAWPFLSREARATRLKELVGQSSVAGDNLTARQAARIIGQEVLHTNVPHKNIAHQNIAHTDTHQNTHVNETKHVDIAPQGFEHTNTTIHTNTNVQGHVNVPHQDTPHTNEPHTNVEHVNRAGKENS